MYLGNGSLWSQLSSVISILTLWHAESSTPFGQTFTTPYVGIREKEVFQEFLEFAHPHDEYQLCVFKLIYKWIISMNNWIFKLVINLSRNNLYGILILSIICLCQLLLFLQLYI